MRLTGDRAVEADRGRAEACAQVDLVEEAAELASGAARPERNQDPAAVAVEIDADEAVLVIEPGDEVLERARGAGVLGGVGSRAGARQDGGG